MKFRLIIKTSIGTLAYCLIVSLLLAQAPQKMSYQAVVRNASNVLVLNTTVGMQISILQGSSSGTPVYVETQTPMTNANGLASLQIGAGTIVSGTFAAIDWANGPYFVKTETDPLGGVAYTITGTSQMLSVPYALYAETAGGLATPLGKSHLVLKGNITDAQAVVQIANELGPNTQYIWIEKTSFLTTVNLTNLPNLIEVRIISNKSLVNVHLGGLTNMTGGLNVRNNPLLNSLSFPTLLTLGNMSFFNNAAISSMSFPLLTSADIIDCDYNPSLSSISCLDLEIMTSFRCHNNPLLGSIVLPSLQSVGSFDCYNNVLLSLVFLASLNTFVDPFPNINPTAAPSLTIYLSALPTAQVNAILNQMLSVTPLSGKYINLSVQNPPAPPTGPGLAAKATLISNGNNVQTD